VLYVLECKTPSNVVLYGYLDAKTAGIIMVESMLVHFESISEPSSNSSHKLADCSLLYSQAPS
jgi:hypothetical protein